jgi:hypothetical protein
MKVGHMNGKERAASQAKPSKGKQSKANVTFLQLA